MAKTPRGHGYSSWVEGNRLFAEERYPDAIWAYTEAIARDPSQADYYHNRAVARAAAADVDGALEDVWRAIELDPGSPETRKLASLLHYYLGDAAKAEHYDTVVSVPRLRGSDESDELQPTDDGSSDQLTDGIYTSPHPKRLGPPILSLKPILRTE